jgi:hypothetical protein
LIKNESDVQPKTIHGDTQALSAAVFGLSHLLGHRPHAAYPRHPAPPFDQHFLPAKRYVS